jgi:hypothetical protein
MKLLSWNIRQGGRKRAPEIVTALRNHSPDVIALSEYRSAPGVKLCQMLAEWGWTYMESTTPAGTDNGICVVSRTPLRRRPTSPENSVRWLDDPCWCGSSKKYKKCHIDREKQPAPTPWEVDALFRGERSNSACLYVELTNASGVCGKAAIASHSVARKMLKQIARNGHVYYHSATVQDIRKAGGKPLLKLIGINKASTLPLFCSKHDSEVFAPLEQDPSARPARCQRNRPQDTQNPAHRYSLLPRKSGVNYPIITPSCGHVVVAAGWARARTDKRRAAFTPACSSPPFVATHPRGAARSPMGGASLPATEAAE